MALLGRKKQALLVLEDGTIYRGYAFAGSGEVLGEVVFNTGMTGYQEVITDPSYKGQIVTMTYPLVGNYGINPEDMESGGIHLEGFVVKEYQPHPSNWRSRQSLKDFLESHDKLAVEGIDTRALTRRIRLQGAMRGVLTTRMGDPAALVKKAKAYPGLVGRNLVKGVTCSHPYRWTKGLPQSIEKDLPSSGRRVVVLDCGVKFNMLRCLEARGCEVLVVPAGTSAEEIFTYCPDGILLTNGPGDPAALSYIVETVRALLGKIPIFGICLGHQILGQAVGGKTAKLKFGHHGINQPVKSLGTGKVEITSQNHGFVVDPASVTREKEVTFDNLNDRTSEGFSYPDLRAFSVQYHPEAAPGPNDTLYLFDRFVEMMRLGK
jgi:carbamoyl-phosphate synthase small subunit